MAVPVALVGFGTRGRQWYSELARSRQFVVSAVCDPDPTARAEARHAGVAADDTFESVTQAAQAKRLQAAIVASSIDTHGPVCLEAIESGLAVLVEKPFALSVREAGEVVRVARDRGRTVMVGQNFRYLRMFRAAKTVIDEGHLGALSFVNMTYVRESHAPVRGLADKRRAALWETGVHYLDVLRFLLGTTAQRATALMRDEGPQATWTVGLEFTNGPLVSCALTWDSRGHAAFERGQQFVARFVGERGTLHILQRWLLLCRAGHVPKVVRRGPRPRSEEALLLDQFASALLHGTEPELCGADNLETIALVEACERSALTGRAMDPRAVLREGMGQPATHA